jgi:hypothetical protein
MYTTTATPMGYGWTYDRFEVMDKDNVWIGYATEWLDQAYDNLSDAYAALDSAGRTTVPSSVASAETKAEAVIADAVAKLTGWAVSRGCARLAPGRGRDRPSPAGGCQADA